MKVFLATISVLLILCTVSCDSDEPATIDDSQIEGYTLVWSDEFDAQGIDTDNWTFETGDGTDFGLPAGWGNNELQIYTTDERNASVLTDGDLSVLSITALEDGAGAYTSAKVTTNDLVSVRYGRIDVKAKMPEGQGLWPAIWMLGDNRDEIDWPGCGEIDIVEVLGNNPATYYSTLHFTDSDNGKGEIQEVHDLAGGSFADDYHVFSIEWTHEAVAFLLDDVQIGSIAIDEGMKEFQRSFYLIMNVAVGGFWPGNPDNTTSFPQSMLVDYVRVYSIDGYEAPAVPVLDIDEETLGANIPDDIGVAAVQEGFEGLEGADVVAFGAGGEPAISLSEDAIDGDQSLAYQFPGGTWGGAWLEIENTIDLSAYTSMKFSLKVPESLADIEVKLEGPNSAHSLFMINYTPVEVSNGFVEYTIPVADFTDLNLAEVNIPFALWNPVDADGTFVAGEFLIDNLYFE